MKTIFNLFLLIGIICISSAQQTAIGEWGMHLNYSHITSITKSNNIVFVGTKSGLFSHNLITSENKTYSKLNGLSSLNITALAYDEDEDMLIIGYGDGQIDLMKNNLITGIPYIKMANILLPKTINHILIDGDLSYISCPFGLVVLNTKKREIKETYYFSNGSNSLEVFTSFIFNDNVNTQDNPLLANTIFVGTSQGLFYANKNDNLLDFTNWKNDCNFIDQKTNIFLKNEMKIISIIGFENNDSGGKNLVLATSRETSNYNIFKLENSSFSNNKMTFAQSNTSGAIIDMRYNQENNEIVLFLNDPENNKRLGFWENNTNLNNTPSFIEFPKENNLNPVCFIMNQQNNNVIFGDEKKGLIITKYTEDSIDIEKLTCPNGPVSYNVGAITNNGKNIILTHGGRTSAWGNTFNKEEVSFLYNGIWSHSNNLIEQNIYDPISVSKGTDGENHFFVGTWNNGLLEFKDTTIINHYTAEGTALQGITSQDWVRIGGLDLDHTNSLWMTISESEKPIVKYSNGFWKNFSISTQGTMTGKIMCTNNNQKWIQLRDNGIVVAREVLTDYNTTITKNILEYRTISENNGLSSKTVNCFVEDSEGSIWVGTNLGLSVCYLPNNIFNTNSYSAEPILIETEDGYVEELFDNTEILDIKVDGGNRKWVSTKSSGVFLISDDGSETIQHFTKENSPLLDNTVYEICVVDDSGEVFFVTRSGLCSYRSNASVSQNTFNNVFVFPNPVKRGYDGLIAVSGLSDDTNVKITDISGNIVFEANSLGGTMTWDGKNFDGEKVSTGVYLFFCTNSNYTESIVKKILIYN